MDKYTLADLVGKDVLQDLQDVLEKNTNISSIILDKDGNDMTVFKYEQIFCTRFTKSSPEGCRQCQLCNDMGAQKALQEGHVVTYRCHTGLVDMAAPIIVGGNLYGYVMGGQVTTKPLQKEKIYELAEKYGLDGEEYWEAAQKVRVLSEENLRENANFINSVADIISDIADNKYQVLKASEEVEKAARMKSDFLANMSHEIRTPMNAVIGMADMALREELPTEAREYITQIKRSGKTLLAIINDILEFSKIESGKMDITLGSYSPMQVFTDVANIVSTRLEGKNVDLILDIPPDLPGELMGDSIRIKQVVTNLANNAAKFTNQGHVTIHAFCKESAPKWKELYVSVEDSGIGIKKENLETIFESFQQVDSKRNRTIEGTGLGLAISKQLIGLMNGELTVESEYEKGSCFSFHIPQLELQEVESVTFPEDMDLRAGLLIEKRRVREQLHKDIERCGGTCRDLTEEEVAEGNLPDDVNYVFVDDKPFLESVEYFAKHFPDITFVVLQKYKEEFKSELSNVVVMKKPGSPLALAKLLKHEDVHVSSDPDEDVVIDFVAPDAQILVVDDNEINLAVVVGLLKPLQVVVETASNGKQAVEMVSRKHYDLIFMDHMMPEMDGVETTHIIRRFHEEYNDVPIIALTANVLEETQAMFLVEGMNDFMAKPIEVGLLINMVRHWLPEKKIIKISTKMQQEKDSYEEYLYIPGLNLDAARTLIGSEALLREVIDNYYYAIDKKYKKIAVAYRNQDWKDYTIEVHALKSASRQIGADDLADLAMVLEEAGNKEDLNTIHTYTGELLDRYLQLQELLSPYLSKKPSKHDEQLPKLTLQVREDMFEQLTQAMDNLDISGMEKAIQPLERYEPQESCAELFEALKEAVNEIDIDACERLIEEIRQKEPV